MNKKQSSDHKSSFNGQHKKISPAEYAALTSIKASLDLMKQRKAILEKEIAILNADIYRKTDELNAIGKELAKKYNLVIGVRALNFATGEIIEMRPGNVPAGLRLPGLRDGMAFAKQRSTNADKGE